MRKIRIGTLVLSILVPLLVGAASAALSAKGMASYATMSKPPLSPPAWVFSVAWTILYIMMGLASYFVLVSKVDTRSKVMAMAVYVVQLAMNFMWSIIFFDAQRYTVAFVWLMIMWCVVILCMAKFYRIDRLAGFMMIPYVLWLTFAAYLNLGAAILSMKGR